MLAALASALALPLALWLTVALARFALLALGARERVDTWLAARGLQVSTFYASLYTSGAPRLLQSLVRTSPALWRLWFRLGAACGVLCIPALIAALVGNAAVLLGLLLGRTSASPLLVPLVPGVNVPSDHYAALFTALLFAGVVHEAGHALCALSLDLPVRGFGVFVAAVYPGAYVDLPCDLHELSAARALMVASAGVWHNTALALTACLVLSVFPPRMFLASQEGVFVVDVKDPSFAAISEGTILVRIDDCTIRDDADYFRCFSAMAENNFTDRPLCRQPPPANGTGCCEDAYQGPQLCWQDTDNQMFRCDSALDLRDASAVLRCRTSGDCPAHAPRCMKAQLPWPSLLTFLYFADVDHATVVAGAPHALWQTLEVVPWKPTAWLPVRVRLIVAKIFHRAARWLRYVASISSGLALVNAAPLSILDGGHILLAASRTGPGGNIPVRLLSTLTSILMAINVTLAATLFII